MTSNTASTTAEPLYDEVEAAVREVHTRFMTELFNVDERVTDPLGMLPLLAELATGDQYKRSYETLQRHADSGEALVGPGYASNIVKVEINGNTASVLDCSEDRADGYSSTGELIVPADGFFKFRTTELVLVDGVWKVSNFFVGGDSRCDPEKY